MDTVCMALETKADIQRFHSNITMVSIEWTLIIQICIILDCNRVIVRVNASELSQASIKLLNRAMHIIKGYNNSKLDSFENIASYHGKPYLCNNATATVPGQ